MLYQDFKFKYNSIIRGEIIEIENYAMFEYLSNKFENELIINPNFFIWNIKYKIGKIRISSSSNQNQGWENEVEKILAGD